MNHLKQYILLMRKAEKREMPDGYTENHHVFPRAVYGDNNRVVALTAREHYIAHALLYKAFRKRYGIKSRRYQQMLCAFMAMSGSAGGKRTVYHNSYLFAEMREAMAEAMKGNTYSKGITFRQNPEYVERLRSNRWYNNGTEQVFQPECPPGYEPGRLPMDTSNINNRGTRNPNAKRWQLTLEDGCVIIVEAMRQWCQENGVDYTRLYRAYNRNNLPYENIITVTKL